MEALGVERSDTDAGVHHLWLLVGSAASSRRVRLTSQNRSALNFRMAKAAFAVAKLSRRRAAPLSRIEPQRSFTAFRIHPPITQIVGEIKVVADSS